MTADEVLAALTKMVKKSPVSLDARPRLLFSRAADTIKALKQRVADLERSEAATERLYKSWHDRALKAEASLQAFKDAFPADRDWYRRRHDLNTLSEMLSLPRSITPDDIARIHQEPGEGGGGDAAWEPGIECEHGYDACPICDAGPKAEPKVDRRFSKKLDTGRQEGDG